jgi:hypothetical protein
MKANITVNRSASALKYNKGRASFSFIINKRNRIERVA